MTISCKYDPRITGIPALVDSVSHSLGWLLLHHLIPAWLPPLSHQMTLPSVINQNRTSTSSHPHIYSSTCVCPYRLALPPVRNETNQLDSYLRPEPPRMSPFHPLPATQGLCFCITCSAPSWILPFCSPTYRNFSCY